MSAAEDAAEEEVFFSAGTAPPPPPSGIWELSFLFKASFRSLSLGVGETIVEEDEETEDGGGDAKGGDMGCGCWCFPNPNADMTVAETDVPAPWAFWVMPCSVANEEMGRWCSLLGKARSAFQTSIALFSCVCCG